MSALLKLAGLLNSRRGERGQMIILVAVSLAVMLFMAALTIDIGFQMKTKRDAQNDADAMVLAGAQELQDATEAEAIAREWGTNNGVISPEVTSIQVNGASCNNSPPDEDYITVRLKRERPTFLAQVFGVGSTEVNVCATARATFGSGAYAIFANDSCPSSDTLKMSGSTDEITGRVHSNCNLQIPGSDNDFDGVITHVDTFSNGGSGNTFTEPAASSGEKPFPVEYEYADIVPGECDFTVHGDMDLSKPEYYLPDGITLKPGVYCQTDPDKKIASPKQGASGNVTFVSNGTIDLAGSDFELTAFWNDILMFANSSSSSAMNVSGSGGSWLGLIVAPHGQINFSGSDNLSVIGGLLGDKVSTAGSNWALSSLDEGDGRPLVKLVQ